MKRIYKWKYWIGDFSGLCLAPFFILYKEDKIRDKVTINHEKIHWQQQKELWYIGFYLIYLYELITKGYKNIRFEKEAYENDWFLNYLDQRKPFSWKQF